MDCATRISQTLVGTAVESLAEPKPKKERVVRQKAKEVRMKKPENVDQLEKNETDARTLQFVLNTVTEAYERTKAPVPYYELILDPDNYMATVDNAFQIAFLARDGVLAVDCDDDDDGNVGVSVVSAADKKAAKNLTKTQQGVMTIAVEDWMEMTEKLDGKEFLLKKNQDESAWDTTGAPK